MTSPDAATSASAVEAVTSTEASPPGFQIGAEQLGRFLHPDLEVGVYVDFDAVRAGLDLYAASEDPGEVQLLSGYVRFGAPMFGTRTSTSPVPLNEALDLWAIREAISSQYGRGPTVSVAIRTDQPWSDITAGLEAFGYTDRGDGILITEARASDVMYTAVGINEGVVVAGQDGDLVAEQLRPESPGPESLLTVLSGSSPLGPIRAAGVFDEGDCGRVYAAGTQVPSLGGTWTVNVGPDATPDRIAVVAGEEWSSNLVTTEPVLESDVLRVELTRVSPTTGIDPSALDLFFAVDGTGRTGNLYNEYRCP